MRTPAGLLPPLRTNQTRPSRFPYSGSIKCFYLPFCGNCQSHKIPARTLNSEFLFIRSANGPPTPLWVYGDVTEEGESVPIDGPPPQSSLYFSCRFIPPRHRSAPRVAAKFHLCAEYDPPLRSSDQTPCFLPPSAAH